MKAVVTTRVAGDAVADDHGRAKDGHAHAARGPDKFLRRALAVFVLVAEFLPGLQLVLRDRTGALPAHESGGDLVNFRETGPLAEVEQSPSSLDVGLPRLAVESRSQGDAGGAVNHGATVPCQPDAIRRPEAQVRERQVTRKHGRRRQFSAEGIATERDDLVDALPPRPAARVARQDRYTPPGFEQFAQQVTAEKTGRPRQENCSRIHLVSRCLTPRGHPPGCHGADAASAYISPG
jgi:hypothetical protein